jgi:hypothetical protein
MRVRSDAVKITRHNDLVALMVLRHYGAPTRLLDWSLSPYVAAYFAVSEGDRNGELWAFNEPQYELNGKEQWRKYPETTCISTLPLASKVAVCPTRAEFRLPVELKTPADGS